MKAFILSSFIIMTGLACSAQQNQVSTLPAGKYETITRNDQSKWDQGDIILLPENKYRISTSDEVGDYKFSVTAQRVFFTSGPLKSLYAKTSLDNETPVIVLPVNENSNSGRKLQSEVWGLLRH